MSKSCHFDQLSQIILTSESDSPSSKTYPNQISGLSEKIINLDTSSKSCGDRHLNSKFFNFTDLSSIIRHFDEVSQIILTAESDSPSLKTYPNQISGLSEKIINLVTSSKSCGDRHLDSKFFDFIDLLSKSCHFDQLSQIILTSESDSPWSKTNPNQISGLSEKRINLVTSSKSCEDRHLDSKFFDFTDL